MARSRAVTQSMMQRMQRAIEREGLPFRGFRAHADGSIEALVGVPGSSSEATATSVMPEDALDAELAAWDAKRGYC